MTENVLRRGENTTPLFLAEHDAFARALSSQAKAGRMVLEEQILPTNGIQTTATGYEFPGGRQAVRINGADAAEKAAEFITQQRGLSVPSHLATMTKKCGAGAMVIGSKGEPLAVSMGFLGFGPTGLEIFEPKSLAAGQPEAVQMAHDAVFFDAARLGVNVNGGPGNHLLSPLFPFESAPEGAGTHTPGNVKRALLAIKKNQYGFYSRADLGFTSPRGEGYFVLEALTKDGKRVVIRQPSMADYSAIIELQRKGWRTKTEQESGLLVRSPELDAFNTIENSMLIATVDGKIVSFVFGFPGLKDDKLVLFSHMASTDPDYESQGVMRMIKLAQVLRAHNAGFDKVIWTYKPGYEREAANHHLNLDILGAVGVEYHADEYASATNVGRYDDVPTDRFLVSMDLNDPAFIRHITGEEPKHRYTVGEARTFPVATEDSFASKLRYPIRPKTWNETDYLRAMRGVFPRLMARGYRVVGTANDFHREGGEPRISEAYFILARE